MKKLLVVAVAALSFAVAWIVATNRQQTRDAAILAEREAAWANQHSTPQETARVVSPRTRVEQRTEVIGKIKTASPEEIIDRLKAGKFGAAANRSMRFVIQQLENLSDCGPAALPAIKAFLVGNQDVSFDFGSSGKKHGDSLVPSSLRFGLFDVVKQIGGDEAEALFAEVLRTTGRGSEVSYLAKALQEMAPGKYRDLAVTVARDLLANPASTDKNDRDYLFGVLAMFNDKSLVNQSQTQFIQPDGQIDKSALKYLQKSLGDQVVPLIAAAYNNDGIDPSKKEPLARVAMTFAGANDQATEIFTAAIMDEHLSLDARRNLLEDWGGEGFANSKNPTPEDQKLLEARLKLAAEYAAALKDPKLITSLGEAQKDFAKMQARLAAAHQ
ncbi:MAG: hypothetical protein JWO95_1696 [Verrucomicrobiales bacterium]|nr:hypothetical protein [Verrucomicrobiales bacterium]